MDRHLLINNQNSKAELKRRTAKSESSRVAQWLTAAALVTLVGLVLVIMISVVALDPFAPVGRMEKTTGALNVKMPDLRPAQAFIEEILSKLPTGQLDLTASEIIGIIHNVHGASEKVDRIMSIIQPATVASFLNYATGIFGQANELLNMRHSDESGRTMLTDIHDIVDEVQRILAGTDAQHIDTLIKEASASMVEARRILAAIDEDTLLAIKHIGQSIDEDHTIDTFTELATHAKTIAAHLEQSAEVSVKLW